MFWKCCTLLFYDGNLMQHKIYLRAAAAIKIQRYASDNESHYLTAGYRESSGLVCIWQSG